MPPTPTKSRKTKSFFEQDKYTAELTSGQLVIGVTILLVFGLVCFMLGVIVGKFQPASPLIAGQPAQQVPPPQAALPAPVNVAEPKPERLSTGPVAVSPAPVSTPQNPPISTARETAVDGPQIVPFPEPDEPVSNAEPGQMDAPVVLDAPVDTPAAPVQTLPELEPTELQTAQTQPAAEEPAAQAVTPTEQAATIQPEPEPAATIESDIEPEPAPAASEARFTVQVAALSNRARAEGLQREIQSNTNYEVSLTPSPNGTLVMVQVGRYAERAAADRIRAEMRERYGFSDSFVTTIR